MNCIGCGQRLPERYGGLYCRECVIELVDKMISRLHKLTGEYRWCHIEMNMLNSGRVEKR